MVPGHVMLLDELPVTTSGKVDRRALPAPAHGPDVMRGGSGADGRTPTETALLAIISPLLGNRFGVDDDFFDPRWELADRDPGGRRDTDRPRRAGAGACDFRRPHRLGAGDCGRGPRCRARATAARQCPAGDRSPRARAAVGGSAARCVAAQPHVPGIERVHDRRAPPGYPVTSIRGAASGDRRRHRPARDPADQLPGNRTRSVQVVRNLHPGDLFPV